MQTTTIERVFAALRRLMTNDFPKVSSRSYKQSSDPFSFDSQPRSDFDSWFIHPPETRSNGLIGGAEHVIATCSIWVCAEAGEDAQGAAVALSGDLARLRHLLVRLDVDSGEVDVNLHEAISARVQSRQEDSVVVIGQVHVSFDYETDGEHP